VPPTPSRPPGPRIRRYRSSTERRWSAATPRDPPSLQLAAYVARRIAELPVLLVLTRRMTPRRDEVDALLHAARSRRVITAEIELEPLGRADVERLVGAVAALRGRQRAVNKASTRGVGSTRTT
jgi:hypothetical protein